MNNKHHIISIEGVNDKKVFFSSLMKFYAPFDVVLSVWGTLPKKILQNLMEYYATGSKIRKFMFGEINIKLNERSLDTILENLCQEEILSQITWGLYKGDIPLVLLRDWDDLNLDYSEVINDNDLIRLAEGLKLERIIESYEIIKD